MEMAPLEDLKRPKEETCDLVVVLVVFTIYVSVKSGAYTGP